MKILFALSLAGAFLVAPSSHASRQPFTEILEFSFGGSAWCALDAKLGVLCSGYFTNGQPAPIVVPAMSHPHSLEVGYDYACALDDTGAHCWGVLPSSVPAFLPLKNARKLSVGSSHFCALDDEGLKCAGAPYRLEGMPRDLVAPDSVAVTDYNSCVTDRGEIRCWGSGFGYAPWPPTRYVLKNPEVFSSGGGFCVKDDSTIRCWGSRTLAAGAAFMSGGMPRFFNGSCAISAAGKISCVDVWGAVDISASYAELGTETLAADGSASYGSCAHDGRRVLCRRARMAQIATPTRDVSVYSASDAVCAADRGDGGDVKCYGGNTNETGNPPLSGLEGTTAIAVNQSMTCAISSGRLRCWGLFNESELPQGLVEPTGVALLDSGICAIDQGKVTCSWRPSNSYQTIRAVVSDLDHPTEISAARDLFCVTHAQGARCYRLGAKEAEFVWEIKDVSGVHAIEVLDIYPGKALSLISDRGLELRAIEGFSSWNDPTRLQPGVTEGVFAAAYDPFYCGRPAAGDGVECFQKTTRLAAPPLKKPSQFRSVGERICAVDEGRLVCWAYERGSLGTVTTY